MKGGWFIGDFEPAVLQTKEFEVAVKYHKKDECYVEHIHKETTEYNYLAKGKMKIQGKVLEMGDIFIINPWEISDPVFLEDCVVFVIRTPSKPKDKYEYLPATSG